MLDYFPPSAATYWFNYNMSHAASLGATLGDIADAVRPFRAFFDKHAATFAAAEEAQQPPENGLLPPELSPEVVAVLAEGNRLWCDGWLAVAGRLESQARDDDARGRRLSAGGKLLRAAALTTIAEWMIPAGAERTAAFDRMRANFLRGATLSGWRFEQVQIPFEGRQLDGLFFPGDGPAPRPVVLAFNGFHSSMEWNALTGATAALNRRGVSVLLFDHPGCGSARYHKQLPMSPQTERSATAAIDWLERRDDIDATRIASLGSSFGGYYTVRAAAHEKRIKACFAWGGWYNWLPDEVFRDGDPDGEIVMSVEQTALDDLHWVTGTSTPHQLHAAILAFTLEGTLDKVTCPLFVIHGQDDVQLPLWHAERVIAEAVNAPERELRVIGADFGGDQHCHLDNLPSALDLLCDSIAERLQATGA